MAIAARADRGDKVRATLDRRVSNGIAAGEGEHRNTAYRRNGAAESGYKAHDKPPVPCR
jgi:hypothetical protein